MKFFFLIVFFLSLSCKFGDKEAALHKGLEGYRKSRDINKEFIENYQIKKVAFFTIPEGHIQYAILLNDGITDSLVNNYSLGLHAYPVNKKDVFLVWDISPTIKVYGDHKYIIGEFREPLRRLDSMAFFLYDRDRYRTIIGNRIVLKNIAL